MHLSIHNMKLNMLNSTVEVQSVIDAQKTQVITYTWWDQYNFHRGDGIRLGLGNFIVFCLVQRYSYMYFDQLKLKNRFLKKKIKP